MKDVERQGDKCGGYAIVQAKSIWTRALIVRMENMRHVYKAFLDKTKKK